MNGYTFERDETGSTIQDTVRRFEAGRLDWDAGDRGLRDRFSVQAFHDRMDGAVQRRIENADATPD
ncbi:hypothetical protein [Halosolutus halophilus]|uniref:hypothetical protein n=1 Tax=Halosolutus halophilus TaxID=1552990 RepID=UPI002235155A|nr:hypothetical protein [Halosolutus halophilus]